MFGKSLLLMVFGCVVVAAHAQAPVNAAKPPEPAQAAQVAPAGMTYTIEGVTIGGLAAIQSQTLAAEAAKRAGLLSTSAPAPTPPAQPAAQAKRPAAVVKARLVAIVSRGGSVLYSEWLEGNVAKQRSVGESILGWQIYELDPTSASIRQGKQMRSLSVGAQLQQEVN